MAQLKCHLFQIDFLSPPSPSGLWEGWVHSQTSSPKLDTVASFVPHMSSYLPKVVGKSGLLCAPALGPSTDIRGTYQPSKKLQCPTQSSSSATSCPVPSWAPVSSPATDTVQPSRVVVKRNEETLVKASFLLPDEPGWLSL